MLVVFGDSHSVIWGGRLVIADECHESRFPLVRTHHLGAALAYNLVGEDGKVGKWGREILSLLETCNSPVSAVMLCFGEIDIRTQVIKRAIHANISIDESVNIIIDRYMIFVDILRKKISAPIFLWGAVASAKDFGPPDAAYPQCGSELERNAATKAFNDCLALHAKSRGGVYFFSIFEKMKSLDFLTKQGSLVDTIHIGYELLEAAIDQFNRIVRENQLGLPDFFDISGALRQKKAAVKKIASTICANQEDTPFVSIDLGFSAMVRKIVIGRTDSLAVLVGNDIDAMQLVYSRSDGPFGADDQPLTIEFDKAHPPFRFIQCRLPENDHFSLGEIDIFADSFACEADPVGSGSTASLITAIATQALVD
jgi:hypothetical protein